jgi:hypothetical protein
MPRRRPSPRGRAAQAARLAAEGGCWLASAREVSRVDGRTAGRLLHVIGWQV